MSFINWDELFKDRLVGQLGFVMLVLSPFSMAFGLVVRDYLLFGFAFVMLVLGGANLIYLTQVSKSRR
ncbi:MAG: hypothetical protein KAW41_06760 [Candidatus Diapherotrites archaeon]|nr:hypothetical protein [Candidatus Diapherotrites archaeon]